MGRYLGIDFAPLSMPLGRRLETFFVLFHLLNFTINPILAILLCIWVLFTDYWFISLGYICYILHDYYVARTHARGGRRFYNVREGPIGRYMSRYFPVSLTKTADLEPNGNYIMGYHPHGIIGYGAIVNFGTEATGFSEKFPGIRPHLLTLDTNFLCPIVRGLFMGLGGCSVSKESIRWILGRQGNGNAAVIVIGGAAEALEAKPGNYKLTLRNRKGFVRLALETGSYLVPVFSFGENDLYKQADNPQGSALRRFQEGVKKQFGVSPPLVYGRGVFNYTFGLMPYRKPINTVVGAPIYVPKWPKPPAVMVDKYHHMYMDALSRLFDEHKGKYGIEESKHLEFL